MPQIYSSPKRQLRARRLAARAERRAAQQLVPINRKHKIAELLDACWHYVDEQNARSVTFEYVMLDGINDKPEHARELAQLLQGQARRKST